MEPRKVSVCKYDGRGGTVRTEAVVVAFVVEPAWEDSHGYTHAAETMAVVELLPSGNYQTVPLNQLEGRA